MTYYEKYQSLVDEVVTKAIQGIIPETIAVMVKADFEHYKSKVSIKEGCKEYKDVHKLKSN